MRLSALITLIVPLACAVGCDQEASHGPPATAPAKDTTMAPTSSAAAGNRTISAAGYDITPLERARVAELASALDKEAYRVTQKAGTEPPGCGTLLDNKREGTYVCVVCGLPLFGSQAKFHSGSGWPSFYAPVDKAHIAYIQDESAGMVRTEIQCARCTAHLGHVFDDGPKPTGQRYCLNSAALTFFDAGKLPPDKFTANPTGMARGDAAAAAIGAAPAAPAALQTAYFAGGCFWGVEHWFDQCPGVVSAESGYMGGLRENPTYEQVCTGATNHAETVKVVFDPSRVTYKQLLDGFFLMHDPTQLNYQGPDHGTQYRSAIFCSTDEQAEQAKAAVAALAKAGPYAGQKIVTQIAKGGTFYPAEEYHQDYLVKNPARTCHVVNPWPTVLGTKGKGAEAKPPSSSSPGSGAAAH